MIREAEILGTVKSMAFKRRVHDGNVYPVLDNFRKWLLCKCETEWVEKLNDIQVRELTPVSLEMR